MWSAEAGNGLEARVGVGKTGKAGGGGRGGGRKAATASQAIPNWSPKPRDPSYRTQSPPGGWGKVVEGRSPSSSHQEVPEEIPLRPRPRRWEGLGRECRAGRLAPGRAAAATLPPWPPLSLSAPGVSHFPRLEKGPHRGRNREQKKRRGGSDRQEAGRGVRGGVLRLHGNRG